MTKMANDEVSYGEAVGLGMMIAFIHAKMIWIIQVQSQPEVSSQP